MAENPVDDQLIEQLKKLQAKYDYMGQDLSSYLDGLLYSDYITYWDYIHVDTLLSLQNPKTSFPDEKVFIMYHQITELYFKLILLEIEQICFRNEIDEKFFLERLDRIIRYFKSLEGSFDVMVEGMEKEQFLKFRMALLPASGFQSAQYRLIEFGSTELINLVTEKERDVLKNADIPAMLEKIYWKSGATDLATGKKTLTLIQFENKYMNEFHAVANKHRERNLHQIFLKNFANATQKEKIIEKLREYDTYANVLWPLAHLKSAGRYLKKDPENVKATGGTNWHKYLPPRFQRRMFFPELWSEQEKSEWGLAAVKKNITNEITH
ncbi:tryptophan 2,3-dioxygenase family protein [Chryseosolibacter indicus]|uniref:Tryptophan 2,3-dioxygenase n=1 Tax=Chryseosolibacter indicus TaxID=2782351 RepID=A0ABS5VPK6_9BACT|nr:tryptophan 2,3-dioxygenase family protein [Chryseosolibacter indicus]MBT1703281.1 tryptophan 2,3-dioxygenase [Chryseosolibacter indicus]